MLYISAVCFCTFAIKSFLVSDPPGFVIGLGVKSPSAGHRWTAAAPTSQPSNTAVLACSGSPRSGGPAGGGDRVGFLSGGGPTPRVPSAPTGSLQPSDTGCSCPAQTAPPAPLGGVCPGLGPGPAAGGERAARPGVESKVSEGSGLSRKPELRACALLTGLPHPHPSEGQPCQHLASASEGRPACRRDLGVSKTCLTSA